MEVSSHHKWILVAQLFSVRRIIHRKNTQLVEPLTTPSHLPISALCHQKDDNNTQDISCAPSITGDHLGYGGSPQQFIDGLYDVRYSTFLNTA